MSILCQFLTKEIGYGVSLNTKSAYVKSDNLMSLLGGRVVVAKSLSNMSNRLSMSSLGEPSEKKNGKMNDIVHLSFFPLPPELIMTKKKQ